MWAWIPVIRADNVARLEMSLAVVRLRRLPVSQLSIRVIEEPLKAELLEKGP
jgi:hypothetical protein